MIAIRPMTSIWRERLMCDADLREVHGLKLAMSEGASVDFRPPGGMDYGIQHHPRLDGATRRSLPSDVYREHIVTCLFIDDPRQRVGAAASPDGVNRSLGVRLPASGQHHGAFTEARWHPCTASRDDEDPDKIPNGTHARVSVRSVLAAPARRSEDAPVAALRREASDVDDLSAIRSWAAGRWRRQG